MTKEEAEKFLDDHECRCEDGGDYCPMAGFIEEDWAKWDEAYEIAYGRKMT
jgi:hypothetical protein